LRHACRADWNCGEFASTFPPITTPKTETDLLPVAAAEPTEAWKPCELRHEANAARLGLVGEVVVSPGFEVVPRLATEGAFEPPHPPSRNARATSTAITGARTVTCPEKHSSLKPV
jgi:hypothetical protein